MKIPDDHPAVRLAWTLRPTLNEMMLRDRVSIADGVTALIRLTAELIAVLDDDAIRAAYVEAARDTLPGHAADARLDRLDNPGPIDVPAWIEEEGKGS